MAWQRIQDQQFPDEPTGIPDPNGKQCCSGSNVSIVIGRGVISSFCSSGRRFEYSSVGISSSKHFSSFWTAMFSVANRVSSSAFEFEIGRLFLNSSILKND